MQYYVNTTFVQAVLPGLNVTSIPLSGAVGPSPKGSLTPSVSYKLIKLDQTDADGHPKFMLAGQDANEPLLPVTEKSLKNRKVLHNPLLTISGLQYGTGRCRTGTPAGRRWQKHLSSQGPASSQVYVAERVHI